MRILLLVLVASIGPLWSLACSDDDGSGGATPVAPTRTPLIPTPVPTLELAEPLDTTGHLIHVTDDVVHVSAFDGSSDVALDLPGMAPGRAGFAGEATIDGARWLYFAVQMSHEATANDRPQGEYAVVRVPIAGGAVAEVYRFRGLSGGGWARGTASISPDGARLLYRSGDGIVLRDLAPGAEEVLFDGTCAEEPNTKCEAYSAPQWSPSGNAMIAKHHRYEITTAAYAKPVAATGAVELADYGGEAQAWGPPGEPFCTYSAGFEPIGAWTVNTETLVADEIGQRFPENTTLERCLPGSNGRLAIQFKLAGDLSFASQVVVDGPATPLPAPGGAIDSITLPDFWRVESWLPDGSGLIVSKSNNCTPCNADEGLVAALTLDGLMHALPFDVATANTSERDYGFVLGVVP